MKLTFIGWVIILALLYLMSKSKTGYNVIYYSLVLILIFLLVTSYEKIQEIAVRKEAENE